MRRTINTYALPGIRYSTSIVNWLKAVMEADDLEVPHNVQQLASQVQYPETVNQPL